jgi:hypothetical protein
LSPGFLVIALGVLPLACGVPFTSTADTTGTSAGGGTSSTASSTTGNTGGAGGGAGGGTSSGTAGGGTGGQKPECKVPTDCPGMDTECKMRTCTAGVCGIDMPMKLAASQVWGDCKARGCDGQGNLVVANFPMDFYDDGNACTNDTCKGPTPENKPVSGILCEGGVCNDSGSCVQCLDNGMCANALKNKCSGGYCVAEHCVDGILDLGETDEDCGGPGSCLPCADGKHCMGAADCASHVCAGPQGQPKICQAATCNDGWQNGTETDLDCGGKCADLNQRCPPGQKCKAPSDCASGVCQAGACQQPICTDGVTNGNESGIDCGGGCGPCLPPN